MDTQKVLARSEDYARLNVARVGLETEQRSARRFDPPGNEIRFVVDSILPPPKNFSAVLVV